MASLDAVRIPSEIIIWGAARALVGAGAAHGGARGEQPALPEELVSLRGIRSPRAAGVRCRCHPRSRSSCKSNQQETTFAPANLL